MQRFVTADDFVISNGFSVAYYPEGVDEIDFDQLERTFRSAPDDKGWNLDFKWGPQRQGLARTGKKLSWDLQEAEIVWEEEAEVAADAEAADRREANETSDQETKRNSEGEEEKRDEERQRGGVVGVTKSTGQRRKVKEVRQIYVRKHDDWRWKLNDGATAMSQFDGVVELVWLPDSTETESR